MKVFGCNTPLGFGLTAVWLAGLLLVAGCNTTDSTSKAKAKDKDKTQKSVVDARTTEMRKWIGQNIETLVAERGQPANTLDATLAGRPPAEAYVFHTDSEMGCTDAFVVQESDGKITDYFCR